MQGNATYRQYLQYHANNHPSAAKRAEAQALLNVVGDDGNLDGNFLTGRREGGFLGIGSHLREQRSNGYNASTVNRSVNPWWKESYSSWKASQNRQNTDNTQDPGGGGYYGGGGGYNPYAAQEARNKADAIAKYDDEIAQAN